MRNFSSVIKAIWITVVIWLIARFVPGLIGTLVPDAPYLLIVSFILMLLLGWFVARKIAKNGHCRCIKSNLYIFTAIEVIGLFSAVTYLLHGLKEMNGYYHTDIYGVHYSEYPIIYGKVIVFQLIYIALCLFLAKKTVTKKQTEDFGLVTENS